MFTGGMLSVAFFAFAYASQTDLLPPWAQYGILGFIIIGFLTRQIVPGWHYRDREEEVKLLRAENSRLIDLILETQAKTLPALQEGTKALQEAHDELNSTRAELRRMREAR